MSTIHDSSSVSSHATSCSSTTSSTPPDVNDQAASSFTLSSVSEQATNSFRPTSKISSVQQQHVDNHEMNEYLQMVADVDNLHVTDNADYLRIIDDNLPVLNDEPGYSELDEVGCYNEPEVQQLSCLSLIEDENAYQEIASDESSYSQVVGDYCSNNQSSYNEQNQAQAASTSEQSFNRNTLLNKPR